MNRRWLLLALLFGLGGTIKSYAQTEPVETEVASVAEVEEVVAHLMQHNFVQGQFTQHRYLKGFSRPLPASGEFAFWTPQGLYWEMQQPFFVATTYTSRAAISWSQQGEIVETVQGDAVQQQVSRIILALLSADIKQLSTQFHVSATTQQTPEQTRSWQLHLVPKQPALAQLIARIVVVGGQYLQEIELVASNGDRTKIQLQDANVAEQPAPALCRRFFTAPAPACDG